MFHLDRVLLLLVLPGSVAVASSAFVSQQSLNILRADCIPQYSACIRGNRLAKQPLCQTELAACAHAQIEQKQINRMSRPNYPDVDYYNCTYLEDGNYPHPTDCTRYIQCHNGRASDNACQDCPQDNSTNCNGEKYFRYDPTKDLCVSPSEVDCEVAVK